ncbi:MAG TPA: ATP-binding protein [Acidimicrobiia bacterium]|nr:ATP-binding protein [Acidimicrobiia bacterium]
MEIPRRPIAPWVALVGTSLLYALAAVAGIGLSAQAVGVTIFWPAAGVAAAVASASPGRVRPYVISGVGLGTILSAAPFVDVNWFHTVGAAGANVAEAVVASAILRARLPQSHRIVRLADIGALLLAALLGPAVGAIIGGTATAITFDSQVLPAVISWLAADGLGITLITPGALAIVSVVKDRTPRGMWLKTIFVGLITILVLVIAIEGKEVTGRSFAYFILLPLILATIFVGQRGTAMLLAGTAFLVVWSTEKGIGPFAEVDSPIHPLTAAQVFLFVIQITLLLVATEASRRRDLLAEIEGVFDAALDAVLVVDESDTIRRANRSSEAMLGERVVGKKFTDFLVHPLDADVMVAQRAVITRGRRADGSEFWAEVSEGKVIEQSRRVRRAVVIRDATQRIEAQEKLEQMRDQFVSNMTHELRTPLTAIIGYTDWLLEGAQGETKSDLETIRKSAAELSNLVDDILDFKRTTEAGTSITTVDLSALVEKVTGHLTPAAVGRDIHLATHFDPCVLVKGDHEQLERVVANLVSNAIKYSRPEGAVTITLRAFDGIAQLVIADQGIGISGADQARIFERFFRASSAVSAGIPGTGLGLAIARDVARAHKGDLILESSLGVGTTMTLRLPLKESAPDSSVSAASGDSLRR